ncbi:hypothetical protein SAMN05443999_11927 [Roseovarius azorensis]|uniref:Lipoprotein n=1 Tax=Roseovarius azorensis TaxID=1287727 RepID=A0A1H7X9E6_9RHOB|nr:hypothetical protein SAMN05443999_11927 [Roseovarius azorensis]
MQAPKITIGAALLFAAGCTAPIMETRGPVNETGNLPEAVLNLAAPGQDLSSARLRPEDGCYWYEHSGPVETTLVPLRSAGGNPICTARSA